MRHHHHQIGGVVQKKPRDGSGLSFGLPWKDVLRDNLDSKFEFDSKSTNYDGGDNCTCIVDDCGHGQLILVGTLMLRLELSFSFGHVCQFNSNLTVCVN